MMKMQVTLALAAGTALGAAGMASGSMERPVDDAARGVVFEIEVTFTSAEGSSLGFRSESYRNAEARVWTDMRPVVGRLSFKNSDGILHLLKEGGGAVLRIDCDNLGDGREVKTEIRLEEQRGWEEGVAAFRSIEPFGGVCG